MTARPGEAGVAIEVRKPRDDEIDVFGLTHKGLVRKSNQDHFLLASVHKRIAVHQTSLPDLARLPTGEQRLAFFAMVADGVGSGDHGEEASRRALEAVTRYVTESVACYYQRDAREETFIQALQDAAMETHTSLLRAATEAGTRSMATTLTVWMGVWPWIYLLQVGDSRYYLFRDGELRQISRDQTIAQELLDSGVFTRDDASFERWAQVLSSAIGGKQTAPVVTRLPADWRNVHLMCSDGLTKHVSDEQIRERLATMTSAQQACEALLQDALDGGGSDNVTVIVGRAVPKET